MDLHKIIVELERERDRLTQAIDLLKESDSANIGRKTAIAQHAGNKAQTSRRGLTPAGRKRLSEAMKKRWAAPGPGESEPFGSRGAGRAAGLPG